MSRSKRFIGACHSWPILLTSDQIRFLNSARSNFPDRAELALPTPSEVSQRFLNGDLRLSAP
jgi:hypothetical protein